MIRAVLLHRIKKNTAEVRETMFNRQTVPVKKRCISFTVISLAHILCTAVIHNVNDYTVHLSLRRVLSLVFSFVKGYSVSYDV